MLSYLKNTHILSLYEQVHRTLFITPCYHQVKLSVTGDNPFSSSICPKGKNHKGEKKTRYVQITCCTTSNTI